PLQDVGSFVARYTAAGAHVWSTTIAVPLGGNGADDVAVDPNGNVFVSGEYQPSGDTYAFLSQFTPAGVQPWLKSFAANSVPITQGLTVAADGSGVVSAGRASPPVDLGGGSLRGFGGSDAHVERYSTAGNFTWGFLDGSDTPDAAKAIALDTAGNVVLVGQ